MKRRVTIKAGGPKRVSVAFALVAAAETDARIRRAFSGETKEGDRAELVKALEMCERMARGARG